MKIGILYENRGLGNRDITKPYRGNPGVSGGTWGFVALGYYLSANHGVHVCYYMLEEGKTPEGTEGKFVENRESAVKEAYNDKVDWFIMYNMPSVKEAGVYNAIRKYGLNTIIRMGCFCKEYEIKQILKTPSIKKIVCVGDWQYRHLDSRIKERAKCLYHFHIMDAYPVACVTRKKQKKNIVMYQGMLKKGKGFHKLARIWRYVSLMVPDAELWVLGNGQLYGEHLKLGPYGLSDKAYEKEIMKYIQDKNGKIRNDVKFLGLQGGNEKINYMRQAKVGVMNPSGETETWGLSASEFEIMGIPVVTRNKYGCKDSVKNFAGGFRFNTAVGFIFYLVLLLKCDKLNYKVGMAGRRRIGKIANADKVATEWYEMLCAERI